MEYKEALHILELPDNFTKEDLKKNFRRLTKACHPDLHPNDAVAEEQFKKLNEAKTFLESDRFSDSSKSADATTKPDKAQEPCPFCSGTGKRFDKVKTPRGYVAVKVDCKFCKGTGKKP